MNLYFFNTSSGKKEVFKPLHPNEVGIYSCGPTVYWNQHIGHMYAYVHWDSMVRTLKYSGYKTKWVMNLTDVGHLTGDNLGDADSGQDKMEKGAAREGLSVWQIADKYIEQFKKSMALLNVTPPDVLCRATEHIPEQIELIKKIESNNFTYKTKTGLVFDTQKFKDYANFAHLNLSKQEAGSRVEVDQEKKNPWDFLLWITNQPEHIMKWPSPWGTGFPGWHIECTAMSVKYLGETFDIHTGGKEHIPVHHTNEMAQAFGAFGHGTANFWLHNEWLLVDGQKMSKSDGNSILATDLVDRGYDPLVFRYLALTTHYKTGMNFTWESLSAAKIAYKKLKDFVQNLQETGIKPVLKNDDYRKQFTEAVADDLNFAKALGITWNAIKDKNLSPEEKLYLVLDFDQVFGLKLSSKEKEKEIPDRIKELLSKRNEARASKDFALSDILRKEIESFGFEVLDTKDGTSLKSKV